MRVLQEIHDVKVVDGLIQRVPKLQDSTIRSQGYAALCRLCNREADWDGGWWGTRPDRTGPYYKNAEWAGTEAVKNTLHNALTSEKPDVVRNLVITLQKHQIAFAEIPGIIAKLAATDPGFQQLQIEMLAALTAAPTVDQIAILRAVAVDEKAAPTLRATAIRALTKNPSHADGMNAAIDAIAPLLTSEKPAPELATLRDEFLHDPRFAHDSASISANWRHRHHPPRGSWPIRFC